MFFILTLNKYVDFNFLQLYYVDTLLILFSIRNLYSVLLWFWLNIFIADKY